MAALAPHTGHAQVVGITGSPGRRQVDVDQRAGHRAPRAAASGSACSRSTRRRRSPAARCSATGCGCRTTRLDRERLHPLDGLARPPRRARLDDAAGAAGARRRRLRRDPGRDRRRRAERGRDRRPRRHHAGAAGARAWATASRPPRPASSRSATSTSSTRPTATAPTRSAATCARCSRSAERPEGAWRPPIVKTVAQKGEGVDEVVAEIDKHRAWLESSGELGDAAYPPRPRRDRGDRGHRAARALGRRARPLRARRPGRRGRRRGRPTRTPPPTRCWQGAVSIASGPVIQICWVTDDIEATERLLSEQFGVACVDADPRRPVRPGDDHAARRAGRLHAARLARVRRRPPARADPAGRAARRSTASSSTRTGPACTTSASRSTTSTPRVRPPRRPACRC